MTMAPQKQEDVEVHVVDGAIHTDGSTTITAAPVPPSVTVDMEQEPADALEQTPNGAKLEDKNGNATANTNNSSSSENDDDDEQLFQFMTGIKGDLAARGPLYKSDWGKPKNMFTVINATVFAFVIQLIPALIFAELMDRQTEGNLATAETLMSSAIIGIIYAIFAGQPLVIMVSTINVLTAKSITVLCQIITVMLVFHHVIIASYHQSITIILCRVLQDPFLSYWERHMD